MQLATPKNGRFGDVLGANDACFHRTICPAAPLLVQSLHELRTGPVQQGSSGEPWATSRVMEFPLIYGKALSMQVPTLRASVDSQIIKLKGLRIVKHVRSTNSPNAKDVVMSSCNYTVIIFLLSPEIQLSCILLPMTFRKDLMRIGIGIRVGSWLAQSFQDQSMANATKSPSVEISVQWSSVNAM